MLYARYHKPNFSGVINVAEKKSCSVNWDFCFRMLSLSTYDGNEIMLARNTLKYLVFSDKPPTTGDERELL